MIVDSRAPSSGTDVPLAAGTARDGVTGEAWSG